MPETTQKQDSIQSALFIVPLLLVTAFVVSSSATECSSPDAHDGTCSRPGSKNGTGNDNSFYYAYSPPFDKKVVGKRFQVARSVLTGMGFPLPQSRLFSLTNDTVQDFVVVTGASKRYFDGLYNALLSARKFLPNHTIIVYDLGLTVGQVRELSSSCNVHVKQFEVQKYPQHVADLKAYCWKPLIIHEVLRTYPGVLWLDSSARVRYTPVRAVWSHLVTQTKGVSLFSTTAHSNFAVTDPAMYDYLPSKLTDLKRTEQWEAGAMFLYRTHTVYNNVIKWWVLCALDKACMLPSQKQTRCTFAINDRFNTYVSCHRYDQAAINILLANLYNFDALFYLCRYRALGIDRIKPIVTAKLDIC